MKILVAFKRVIDPDARIKLKADKSAIDTGSADLVHASGREMFDAVWERAVEIAG